MEMQIARGSPDLSGGDVVGSWHAALERHRQDSNIKISQIINFNTEGKLCTLLAEGKKYKIGCS